MKDTQTHMHNYAHASIHIHAYTHTQNTPQNLPMEIGMALTAGIVGGLYFRHVSMEDIKSWAEDLNKTSTGKVDSRTR